MEANGTSSADSKLFFTCLVRGETDSRKWYERLKSILLRMEFKREMMPDHWHGTATCDQITDDSDGMPDLIPVTRTSQS